MKDPRSWVFLFVSLWSVIVLGILLAGCAPEDGIVTGAEEVVPVCPMNEVQDPRRGREALVTYRNRHFLSDGVHLGWDIDLPEGTPIYPIGCGIVRVARAAQGYGTFAVVIEHRLPTWMHMRTGGGYDEYTDRFLSIYGHLRPTPDRAGRMRRVQIYPGAMVTQNTIIGYVQYRGLNGDGNEHLHLGIRLQTAAEAAISDPRAWFRGYDRVPTVRDDFADPEYTLTDLRQQFDGGSLFADASAY